MANEKKQSSEAALREIRRRTRWKFSPEEKIRIVLEGLRGEASISELCRREGIAYRDGGANVADSTLGRPRSPRQRDRPAGFVIRGDDRIQGHMGGEFDPTP